MDIERFADLGEEDRLRRRLLEKREREAKHSDDEEMFTIQPKKPRSEKPDKPEKLEKPREKHRDRERRDREREGDKQKHKHGDRRDRDRDRERNEEKHKKKHDVCTSLEVSIFFKLQIII
ncbi:unnamed protein product [Strongylus vulgaris]|uniref:Uncharacterized protein n=1 Tax=Strongylus vulgaris TaxID=40348 RepID=A0A3P7KZI0_STRVU|nr:unnamed protein product [Strongylus vulgaris]